MELREKIARIITTEHYGKWIDDRLQPTEAALGAADRILAIPEIAEALARIQANFGTLISIPAHNRDTPSQ